ncbi:MAG: hypothetical protein WED82_08410, partial [Balneolales bacterium]
KGCYGKRPRSPGVHSCILSAFPRGVDASRSSFGAFDTAPSSFRLYPKLYELQNNPISRLYIYSVDIELIRF